MLRDVLSLFSMPFLLPIAVYFRSYAILTALISKLYMLFDLSIYETFWHILRCLVEQMTLRLSHFSKMLTLSNDMFFAVAL